MKLKVTGSLFQIPWLLLAITMKVYFPGGKCRINCPGLLCHRLPVLSAPSSFTLYLTTSGFVRQIL